MCVRTRYSYHQTPQHRIGLRERQTRQGKAAGPPEIVKRGRNRKLLKGRRGGAPGWSFNHSGAVSDFLAGNQEPTRPLMEHAGDIQPCSVGQRPCLLVDGRRLRGLVQKVTHGKRRSGRKNIWRRPQPRPATLHAHCGYEGDRRWDDGLSFSNPFFLKLAEKDELSDRRCRGPMARGLARSSVQRMGDRATARAARGAVATVGRGRRKASNRRPREVWTLPGRKFGCYRQPVLLEGKGA